MPPEHAYGWHGRDRRQLHAVVSECIPAFFLTPRIFLVLFFLSLICFLDLLTGASASPFCKQGSSISQPTRLSLDADEILRPWM